MFVCLPLFLFSLSLCLSNLSIFCITRLISLSQSLFLHVFFLDTLSTLSFFSPSLVYLSFLSFSSSTYITSTFLHLLSSNLNSYYSLSFCFHFFHLPACISSIFLLIFTSSFGFYFFHLSVRSLFAN